MLRLTRHLFCQDPQPKYADFYERTLYNQILSARHPETTADNSTFSNLNRAVRRKSGAYFQRFCFLLLRHGMESAAKFADSIYFQ